MNTGKVLLGVLAGLAVGSLLGILFAPEKGSVTRKKISDKTHDLKEELTEKFNEFLDDVNEKFEQVKDEAGKVKAKAGSVVNDMKSATE